MNKTLILVVEDDRPIRNLIVTTLKTHDYKYLAAENGFSAILEASSHNPDIVLLDLGLPDMEGVEVIKKIRTWSNMPIIVISARSEDTDKIEALDAGADDYITKPFAIEELLARIRRALKKSSMADGAGTDGRSADDVKEAAVLANGDGRVKLDKKQHIVTVDCNNVELTQREFAMLQTLLENMDIVLSRETLLDKVCGYDYVGETNIVDVYVRYLRSKVDDAFGIKLIQTVRGVGYVIRSH